MAKMTLKELKHQIADILEEAKKSKKSSKKSTKHRPQVEAYGHYDVEHDFSTPLGDQNLYRQQGAVNWGPYTVDTSAQPLGLAGGGSHNPNAGSAATQMHEQALRALVREVIENGLVDESSAWAPFISKPKAEQIFESSWDEIVHNLSEGHWYDRKGDADKPEGKAQGFEKDKKRGGVKDHGFSKSSKK